MQIITICQSFKAHKVHYIKASQRIQMDHDQLDQFRAFFSFSMFYNINEKKESIQQAIHQQVQYYNEQQRNIEEKLKICKKIMTYLIMEIGLGRCWLYQWRAFLQDELSYIQLEGGFHSSNLKLFQCSNLSDSFVDFVKLSKWQIVSEVESCYKNYKEISKIKAQQTQLTYIDTLDQIRMIPAQEKQKQRKRNKFLLSQSKRKVSKDKRKYGEQKKRVVEGKQQ